MPVHEMAEPNYDSEFDAGFAEPDLKLEPASPSGNNSGRYTFSRTSSTGSLHTSSSAQNSDADDSDDKSTTSYKERRREAHTHAEQKRRDAIKKGYENLQDLVPTCQQQDSLSGYKVSKATVLQKSIDYIQFLLQQRKKQEDEIAALRKEVVALQIMRENYEQIVQAHQSRPNQASNQLSDEVRFHVLLYMNTNRMGERQPSQAHLRLDQSQFQTIMDSLFQSFNTSISVANFTELSRCVFSWIEEYCKPQTLRELVLSILRQLNTQLT